MGPEGPATNQLMYQAPWLLIFGVGFCLGGVICMVGGVNGIRHRFIEVVPGEEITATGWAAVCWGAIHTCVGITFVVLGVFFSLVVILTG